MAINLKIVSVLIICSVIWVLLAACGGYRGPVTDHFDGSRFFNKEKDHTFSDMIKWLWEMETVKWPEWVEDPIQTLPEKRVADWLLRVTYINHATVLIQTEGLNILTDPVWSFRVGPIAGFGVKRVRKPGVSLEDLPEIDYVLISHDHYDHLDLPSLKKIVAGHDPTILVGLGVKKILSSNGISKVVEMDWWQEYASEGRHVRFTFVPAVHNSGRNPFMKNRTLWGGFVISGAKGHIYFAGDTAFGAFVNEVADRFDSIRLSILPIGSYEKRWFMKYQHMNPDDAVKAHILLRSHQSMGIHYGTFVEHPEQPIDAHEKDLAVAMENRNLHHSRFWVLKFGEGRSVSKKNGLINKGGLPAPESARHPFLMNRF